MICMNSSLHNYSTRRDSLDLRVVNVPQLLCTTYQLKEQIHRIHEEHQQGYPLLPANGSLIRKESLEERQYLRRRIEELEEELQDMKRQLYTGSTSDTL